MGKHSNKVHLVRTVKQRFDEDDDNLEYEWNNISIKMKSLYYQGKKLDKINTDIYECTMYNFMDEYKHLKKYQRDKILDTIIFRLFIEEDGKLLLKDISINQIEIKNEIGTTVSIRTYEEGQYKTQETKKNIFCELCELIATCTEDQLDLQYKKAELKEVRLPEDLDKYYNSNCFVKFTIELSNLWIQNDCMRRIESGIQYVITHIDIIKLPFLHVSDRDGNELNCLQRPSFTQSTIFKELIIKNTYSDNFYYHSPNQIMVDQIMVDQIICPEEFICPITKQIMIDPVIRLDGRTFERVAIENVLKRNYYKNTFDHNKLHFVIANRALQNAINKFNLERCVF